jgi:glycosyltransferase involved in cell wall biosynthesis
LFPQLALAVGLRQRVERKRKPIVAWTFNLGGLYPGVRQKIARIALARVDRFIVHARAEVSCYADWLGLPHGRFCFVPLQRAPIAIEEREDNQEPFLLSMGSARRDYATLFEAVRLSRRPTVVVAARHALEGLDIPPNVSIRSSLSAVECHRLAQRARINVVAVLNDQTASGQVTIVEAMRMGRAVVATRCTGSEDYIEHGVNGLLVEPRSVETLRWRSTSCGTTPPCVNGWRRARQPLLPAIVPTRPPARHSAASWTKSKTQHNDVSGSATRISARTRSSQRFS